MTESFACLTGAAVLCLRPKGCVVLSSFYMYANEYNCYGLLEIVLRKRMYLFANTNNYRQAGYCNAKDENTIQRKFESFVCMSYQGTDTGILSKSLLWCT